MSRSRQASRLDILSTTVLKEDEENNSLERILSRKSSKSKEEPNSSKESEKEWWNSLYDYRTVKKITAPTVESCALSAFSVLSPLALLALGSSGESHDEILTAFASPNDKLTKKAFASANKRLGTIKRVDFNQVNKAYIHEKYAFDTDFNAMANKVFELEVTNLDFEEQELTAEVINSWIEYFTNKLIKDFINAEFIEENTAAILINAAYFTGKWMKPFKKDATRDQEFYVNEDDTITVRMMYQVNDFKYEDSEEFDAQFLEMAYEGGEISLIVALPNKINGVNDLVEKIKNPAGLHNAFINMSKQEVEVFLPRFQFETSTDLKHILEGMNIKTVYEAEMSNIEHILDESQNLYVSSATQRSFIEINEEGSEASVISHYSERLLSVIIRRQPLKFNADHPFLFFLMENNNILINGVFRS